MRTQRRAAGLIVVFALWLVTSGAHAEVARASTTNGGAFIGSIYLNPYPCNSSCPAVFSGQFRGGVGGVELGSAAYAAVFPDPTGGAPAILSGNLVTTGLLYTEACPLGPDTPALGGTAGGVFTVSGGALADTGGNIVARGITLTGSWSWSRVAVGAGILLFLVDVSDSHGTVLASNVVLGAGTAVFAPLPPITASSCAHPADATVAVGGVIGQPA
jgi:hypothetical protein